MNLVLRLLGHDVLDLSLASGQSSVSECCDCDCPREFISNTGLDTVIAAGDDDDPEDPDDCDCDCAHARLHAKTRPRLPARFGY